MRALLLLSFLLVGCAGTSERDLDQAQAWREAYVRTLTGQLTPQFYMLDRKWPHFTVEMHSVEYTLAGYGLPAGQKPMTYFLAYQHARDTLLGQELTCHEIPQWHLICYNEDGENIGEDLRRTSVAIAQAQVNAPNSDRIGNIKFDTLFFIELPHQR